MAAMRTMMVIAAAFVLAGCGKIESLLKGEPSPSASASVAAPPTPSAPDTADATVAAPASVAPKPVVAIKPRDAGGVDASAADAGQDAGPAFVASRPTRGTFTCDPPGCICEAGVACDITCPPAAPCNVEVKELATASIHGKPGPLSIQCRKGAKCTIVSGGGGSTTRCSDAQCDVECHGGNCTMQCAGGRCKINKKGVGAVSCTGCI
jgi:hypothetical protein